MNLEGGERRERKARSVADWWKAYMYKDCVCSVVIYIRVCVRVASQ